eukprot:Rmarinus@m.4878
MDIKFEDPLSEKKVVIVGAGIAGLSTAFYLSQDDNIKVICIDRHSEVANETSLFNGAILCPSISSAWPSLKLVSMAIKGLIQGSEPTRPTQIKVDEEVRKTADFWRWCFRFGVAAFRQGYLTSKLYELSMFSLRCMDELDQAYPDLDYSRKTAGVLQLKTAPSCGEMVQSQFNLRELDREGNVTVLQGAASLKKLVPFLNDGTYHSGLLSAVDGTGDIHRFCLFLRAKCEQQNVRFRMDTKVSELVREGGRVAGVRLENGEVELADAIVLAAGNHTPALARDVGLFVPIMPVKGHCLDIPYTAGNSEELRYTVDHSGGFQRVLSAPVDGGIRISGTTDFCGFQYPINDARVAQLVAEVKRDFSENAIDYSRCAAHSCLRPVSADDIPFVGETYVPGLFINAGYGSKGWTIGVGCGRILSDILKKSFGMPVAPAAANFDAEAFSPTRLWLPKWMYLSLRHLSV